MTLEYHIHINYIRPFFIKHMCEARIVYSNNS